jgi:hypothetical protein
MSRWLLRSGSAVGSIFANWDLNSMTTVLWYSQLRDLLAKQAKERLFQVVHLLELQMRGVEKLRMGDDLG